MKKLIVSLFSAAFCAALSSSVFAGDTVTTPITVSNVSFSQSKRTQAVTVNYDLSTDGDPAIVRLDVETNGVSIGQENIRTVSGSISTNITDYIPAGTGKQIVWEARKDWRGHLSTNAEVFVTAYYTNHPPVHYMVIDISSGADAVSYPVSYLFDAPNPLTDPSCASNHIWLRYIEPGTFTMGSPASESGRTAATEAQHSVTLTKPFYAGIFDVTRAQYRLVTGANPSQTTSGAEPIGLCPVSFVSYNMIRGTTNGTNWPSSHAVDATSFMGVLRAKTGGALLFDLPTEAQWEYACRAGTTGAWNNGTTTLDGTDAQLTLLGWFSGNSDNMAHPVGRKAPNVWGLYDMHGNLFEWCLDWAEVSTPAGGEDPGGVSTGSCRAQRGGCYALNYSYSRAAFRTRDYPTMQGSAWDSFRIFLTVE